MLLNNKYIEAISAGSRLSVDKIAFKPYYIASHYLLEWSGILGTDELRHIVQPTSMCR